MRKSMQLFYAMAVMLMITSCGTKNSYTIDGTVASNEMNGKTVYLYNTEDPSAPVDSAVVTDNKFTFTGSAAEPWLAMVVSEAFQMQCIVENGTINMTNEGIGGTPLNDKLQGFLTSFNTKDIEIQMEEYIPLYYSATSAEERAAAKRVLDSLEQVGNGRMLEACWKLYNENGDNVLGVMAMQHISQLGKFTFTQFDSIVKAASSLVAENKNVQAKLAQLKAIEATSAGKHYVDIEGVDSKLSDLIAGKVALVDFYASWCGPCRNEIKDHLVPLWKKYKDKGLVIVGLNVWERGDAAARKAAHEKVMSDLGITYPQLVDSTRTATNTYGVQGIPQIMLIDKDGTILARDLRGAAIEEAIVKALGK